MTRKQYEKKVRQLQRNIARYAKETGGPKVVYADRVRTPLFGTLIEYGTHAGEIRRSYKQVWEALSESLEGTGLLDGIN